MTIPGRKSLYRLFNQDGIALCDLLTKADEPAPEPMTRILIRHPFSEQRRAYVTPTTVEGLYKLYWSNGEIKEHLPPLKDIREYVKRQLNQLRSDIRRELNPTPHKVSLTGGLFQFMHDLWVNNIPIGELR